MSIIDIWRQLFKKEGANITIFLEIVK